MSVPPNHYGQQPPYGQRPQGNPPHGQPMDPQYSPQPQYSQQAQFQQAQFQQAQFQQAPYGQPGHPMAPQQTKSPTKWIVIGLAGFLVVAIIAVVVANVLRKPEEVPLGTPVIVEDVVFVVTQYECGVEATDILDQPYVPAGELCRVHVSATNNGTEDKSLLSGAILYDDDDTRYDAEFSLALSMDDAFDALTLSAGQSAEGYVYFDIPTGANPTRAEVGPMFGDYAYVSLR